MSIGMYSYFLIKIGVKKSPITCDECDNMLNDYELIFSAM